MSWQDLGYLMRCPSDWWKHYPLGKQNDAYSIPVPFSATQVLGAHHSLQDITGSFVDSKAFDVTRLRGSLIAYGLDMSTMANKSPWSVVAGIENGWCRDHLSLAGQQGRFSITAMVCGRPKAPTLD